MKGSYNAQAVGKSFSQVHIVNAIKPLESSTCIIQCLACGSRGVF